MREKEMIPADTQNVEKILPSQANMCALFKGSMEEFYPAMAAMMHSVLPHKSVEEKFSLTMPDGRTYASLGTELSTLFFYQFLIKIGGYKRILEIGTYVGVSAMFLAEMAEKVTTLESGAEFCRIAQENIKANKHDNKVTIVFGAAQNFLEMIESSKSKYDFILMDGAKQDYPKMLDSVLNCLAGGGLLLIDDVFMHGDALNEQPKTDKGIGTRKTVELVAALPPEQFIRVLLPIGNGLLMVRRHG